MLKGSNSKMDQMQVPVSLPHIVQVYPPVSIHPSQGKISYQQTITSESLQIPIQSIDIQNQHLLQNQTVMSCQQIHLQNMPIQHQDMTQQLQITSHVILPQVSILRQRLLTNNFQQQYFGQYEAYMKDQQCVLTKVEPEISQVVCEQEPVAKPEPPNNEEMKKIKIRRVFRGKIRNPSSWACNVRKLKHERGEAYISCRGKYVPEKKVNTTKDCLYSCKFKCNEKINNADRQHIFSAFYSLSSNEKKHFLLNTTERNYIKAKTNDLENNKRKYSFKYFFVVRAVRHVVCKNFYLGTLAISQRPIYNVHMSKSELNLPKPDGRGQSEASSHPLPNELKDRVRQHIMSFTTVNSKPVVQFCKKKQFLESNLSIKQMYNMYVAECKREDVGLVKESMYRKIVRTEFNIYFKKTNQLCVKCKGSGLKKK